MTQSDKRDRVYGEERFRMKAIQKIEGIYTYRMIHATWIVQQRGTKRDQYFHYDLSYLRY